MLTLYYRPTCPFCHKVLEAASTLDVELEKKDITDLANTEALVARGGKRQVPYLVDSELGVEMYESNDIIDYLTEHYTKR